MAKTRLELVNQALSNLGVLAAGQTAAAEDIASVDAFVDGLLRRLALNDIVHIGSANEIDEEYFHPVAILLADAAKAEFGGGAFDTVAAEGELRRLTRAGPTYERLQAEYF